MAKPQQDSENATKDQRSPKKPMRLGQRNQTQHKQSKNDNQPNWVPC